MNTRDYIASEERGCGCCLGTLIGCILFWIMVGAAIGALASEVAAWVM